MEEDTQEIPMEYYVLIDEGEDDDGDISQEQCEAVLALRFVGVFGTPKHANGRLWKFYMWSSARYYKIIFAHFMKTQKVMGPSAHHTKTMPSTPEKWVIVSG